MTFSTSLPTPMPSLTHLRYLPTLSSRRTLRFVGPEETQNLLILSRLVESIPSASPPSLHLPSALRNLDIVEAPKASKHVERLQAVCAEAGVELLWHEDDPWDDYVVSPSFWRYAIDLKAGEGAERKA